MTTLTQCFDTSTLIALAAEPGGHTVTANLLQMFCLALKDPEGCVRFNPHSLLDAESFSRAFNCSAALVKNSIETLLKYGILIAEDGKLFIERLRNLKQEEAAAAEQEEKLRAEREKTRHRVAKSRALKKEYAANSVTKPGANGNAGPVTDFAATTEKVAENNSAKITDVKTEFFTENNSAAATTNAVTEFFVENNWEAGTANTAKISASTNVTDHVTDNVTGFVTPVVTACNKVTQTRTVTELSEDDADLCNASCNGGDKHIYNNINNNKYALYAYKPISLYSEAETKNKNAAAKNLPNKTSETNYNATDCNESNNGLTSTPKSNGKLILLDKLPLPCRNVLNAWNKLPLKKFKGLIPSMEQKLEQLMQHYGEETVRKTVENIAKSEFLLGKKGSWFLTLGWLLRPENFAKVLSGKYQDQDNPYNNNNGNYMARRWQEGEPFPFYLPGEPEDGSPMSAEEIDKALDAFLHPHNDILDEAARILALPLQEEVPA